MLVGGLAGCSLIVGDDSGRPDDDDARAAQSNAALQYLLDEGSGLEAQSTGTVSLPLGLVDVDHVEDAAGNRGLRYDMVDQDSRADSGSMMEAAAALADHSALTLEVVADLEEVTREPSRIVDIDERNQGDLSFRAASATELRLHVNDQEAALWTHDIRGRQVFHVVVDTNEVLPVTRYRLYADGEQMTTVPENSVVELGDPIEIGSLAHFVIGNRPDLQRSPRGTIFYVALYTRALSDREIEEHADALLADDDSAP